MAEPHYLAAVPLMRQDYSPGLKALGDAFDESQLNVRRNALADAQIQHMSIQDAVQQAALDKANYEAQTLKGYGDLPTTRDVTTSMPNQNFATLQGALASDKTAEPHPLAPAVDYVKQHMDTHPPDALGAELQKSGWDDTQIQQAFDIASGKAQMPSPERTSGAQLKDFANAEGSPGSFLDQKTQTVPLTRDERINNMSDYAVSRGDTGRLEALGKWQDVSSKIDERTSHIIRTALSTASIAEANGQDGKQAAYDVAKLMGANQKELDLIASSDVKRIGQGMTAVTPIGDNSVMVSTVGKDGVLTNQIHAVQSPEKGGVDNVWLAGREKQLLPTIQQQHPEWTPLQIKQEAGYQAANELYSKKAQQQQMNATFKMDLGKGLMTQDATDLAAQNYLLTGQLPAMGMGGAAQKMMILNKAAALAKEQGLTAPQIQSDIASLKADTGALKNDEKQYDMMDKAERQAQGAAKLLRQSSANYDRTGIKFVNTLEAMAREATQDPKLADLQMKLLAFSREYYKVVTNAYASAQELSVGAQAQAEKMLNTSNSWGALEAKINAAEQEMANTKKTFKATISERKGNISNRGAGNANKPDPLGIR